MKHSKRNSTIEISATFLGTGTSQGVPVIGCDCNVCQSNDPRDRRLRTSLLLQIGSLNIVIDAGPDFRQQMLSAKVKRLDAVLLTHEHNDHIIGLDDVRPFNFSQRMDMPVYGLSRVLNEVKHRFQYIFASNPYPGSPRLLLQPIDKYQPLRIKGIPIQPIEVIHGKMPVLGFRVGDFTYITDAKTIATEELEKIKGSKVLVLNALHHKEHHSHLNLEEALDIITILKPQRAYLTHISHRMGPYSYIQTKLPDSVELAYDGLCIQIGQQ